MLRLAPLTVLCLLALAPPAHAATVSVEAGALRVEAAPGESNSLTLGTDGSELIVTDGGEPDELTAGAGCDLDAAADEVSCPAAGVTRLDVDAGDRADQVDAEIALPARMSGGSGNDVLAYAPTGTATAPAAVLEGGEDDDSLSSASGADTLRGGPGFDTLEGGDGADTLEGADDVDLLQGGAGDDRLSGGEGNDSLAGEADKDVLAGETGADSLTGGDGDDGLAGGEGNDALSGDAGNDGLTGDAGDDLLYGGAGNDGLGGGDGNDSLSGEPGNDTLAGDAGDDLLYGGDGDDGLAGGAGVDSLRGDLGNDRLAGDSGDDALTGSDGDDSLAGGTGNDSLTGDRGADTISGGDGNDLASGGDGNDRVLGDRGRDRVDGGAGNDRLEVRDRKSDSVLCGSGRDRARAEVLDSLDYACERVDYGPAGKIGRLKPIRGGGRFVRIPGQTWAKVDRRILPDVLYLIRRYHVRVGDGYALTGHKRHGEHPLGLAVDLYPGPGGSWREVAKLAKWAEPRQNRPRWPFRWVGWNHDPMHGDPQHCRPSRGCPPHLHLSWAHSPGRPGHPVRTVWVWQVRGR